MQYIAYWGGHNSFVFMGDERIKQMFKAYVGHVVPRSQPSHSGLDISYQEEENNVEVSFLWRPILNSSVSVEYETWIESPLKQKPKMIVTGCATWSIRENNASSQSLEDYKTNLTRLISSIDSLAESGTLVIWVLQDSVRVDKLSPENSMITNEQIDLYNTAAIEVLLKYTTSNAVHIWGSARLLSQGYSSKEDEDGMLMGPLALDYAVQILLNMYCNEQMNFNDGSCCSDPEPVTGLQLLTFMYFGLAFMTAVSLVLYRKVILSRYQSFTLLVDRDDNDDGDDLLSSNSPTASSNRLESNHSYSKDSYQTKSYYELFTCLGRLGVIMAYAFLCDRTNFFMKENKYYTAPNFFLPIAYVFALGLFFTEESKATKVLHRDQIDEWKGWMQLVLLTYNMTGASQVLPIYVNARVLVSSYLFLLGFEHFTYYWHRGDHCLYRLWQVIYIHQ